jgi:peroxiredoxin
LQLQAYNEKIAQIRARGGTLVGISPMLPSKNRELKARLDLEFELLSDIGNSYAEKLGLAYRLPEPIVAAYGRIGRTSEEFNGVPSWELPFTAAFAVGQDCRVRYAWKEGDYTFRPEIESIILALFS